MVPPWLRQNFAALAVPQFRILWLGSLIAFVTLQMSHTAPERGGVRHRGHQRGRGRGGAGERDRLPAGDALRGGDRRSRVQAARGGARARVGGAGNARPRDPDPDGPDHHSAAPVRHVRLRGGGVVLRAGPTGVRRRGGAPAAAAERDRPVATRADQRACRRALPRRCADRDRGDRRGRRLRRHDRTLCAGARHVAAPARHHARPGRGAARRPG